MDKKGLYTGVNFNGPVYFDEFKKSENRNYAITASAGQGMSFMVKSLITGEVNGEKIPTLLYDPQSEYQHKAENRGIG